MFKNNINKNGGVMKWEFDWNKIEEEDKKEEEDEKLEKSKEKSKYKSDNKLGK